MSSFLETNNVTDIIVMKDRIFSSHIRERFYFSPKNERIVRSLTTEFGYGNFGEFMFYARYSRTKQDGSQENWADCVIRVTNGIFSIVKDYYTKNHLLWDEEYWQNYSLQFCISMFKMEWLPPGRGLFSMGTDYVYDRGSIALFNCAFTTINNLAEDADWCMDLLMNGVGVGFECKTNGLKLHKPDPFRRCIVVIDDSREGWCQSVKMLLESYTKEDMVTHEFDYKRIRPKGLPIKGYGGLSSGPEPLIQLHKEIREYCDRYINDPDYNEIMLKTDIMNCIGCCVVAGNVRRSAEIAIGDIKDQIFMDLKDYSKYPYRSKHGWMSNNSVRLYNTEDFDALDKIAKRVVLNGEPGYLNMKNMKYGRVGNIDESLKLDEAIGINPCGEIPLEDKEVCNICETFPTNCDNIENWYRACSFGAFYCYAIYLMQTHRPETNRVIMRNRRIGVGLSDFTGWKHAVSVHKITRFLRNGYKEIRKTIKQYSKEFGTPESIRVTTVKPGGTVPKLVGKTSGVGYPNFNFMIRRIRMQEDSPICKLLEQANIPFEKDKYSSNTVIFEFPLKCGPAKQAEDASLWEQAMNLVLLQREWADNAVSNTLNFKPKWIQTLSKSYEFSNIDDMSQRVDFYSEWYNIPMDCDYNGSKEYSNQETKILIDFDLNSYKFNIKIYEFDPKHEEDDIEAVLSTIAPHTKSVSLLPHVAKGVYEQMPEEGITEEEYLKRLSEIKTIDWSNLRNSDGQDERYCTGDSCEINLKEVKK